MQRYAWVILFLLVVAQFVMSMGSFSYGPLAPFLRDTLNISRGQVGTLVSLFYFTATLAAIPAGLLVDQIGARPMLILCLLLEGMPYALQALAENFLTLALFSGLSGFGYGFINQVSTKGIVTWFPPGLRATAMGIKQAGVTFGGAAAALLLPLISVNYSWQMAVFTIGLLMFCMVAFAFLFYRERPEGSLTSPRTPTDKEGMTLKEALSQPTLLILMVVVPFLAFSHGSSVSFLVLYLKEQVRMPVEMAGRCMTASMVAATLGRVVWGLVSDRVFREDRIKPIIIISSVGALSTLGIALLTPLSSHLLAYIFSALQGFSLSGWNALVMVLAAELGGAKLAASVVSVVITVVGIGFLVGPIVFGYVADHLGYFTSWMGVFAASLISIVGFTYLEFLHRKEKSP